MLTRYKFEILRFLEKNGRVQYSHRQLSDTLTISNIEISNDISDMVQSNLIIKNNDYLEISEKGLKALEPYRVKKAVILAAGFGSRMMPATKNQPKPMVIVNGKRIIETLLDALVKVEIKDITIIRGYKGDKFNELLTKYPFIKFINNLDYDKYNNIINSFS